MKTKFTEVDLQFISQLQAKHGITRKSAIRRFQKEQKEARAAVSKAAKASEARIQRDLKAAKVPDHKQAAANDRPETPKPTTPAGDARAVGIALYKTAGRPSKADFIHVYGAMGAKWTWEARAKAVGLPSAQAAAQKFQAMLQKPAESCLVKEEPKAATGAVA